jgi:hypothetical protein
MMTGLATININIANREFFIQKTLCLEASMKFLFALSIIMSPLLPASACPIKLSNSYYRAVLECQMVGAQKLIEQAESYGVTIDMNTFRLSGVDARPDNPSSYFWWSADVTNVNGRTDVFPPGEKPVLTKLTQKYDNEPCF